MTAVEVGGESLDATEGSGDVPRSCHGGRNQPLVSALRYVVVHVHMHNAIEACKRENTGVLL